ncbi:MAG: potassium channel family protein [Gammaproteobacteria bacterium]|nr:potassium channel family protein [Gammaproteobacteria bacterium]
MSETESAARTTLIRRIGTQRNLFFSLGALLFVSPVLGSALAFYIVLGFVMLTGPIAVAHSRVHLTATLALALFMVAPGLVSVFIHDYNAAAVSSFFGTLFFGYLAVLVTRRLLVGADVVDGETLWAAVNVYLAIGLAFAFLYSGVDTFNSDAFVGHFIDGSQRTQMEGFVYFSFVTLTTLGYGDITPNNTLMATFVFVEATFGQLYVAIMIARLVSLYGMKPRGGSD